MWGVDCGVIARERLAGMFFLIIPMIVIGFFAARFLTHWWMDRMPLDPVTPHLAEEPAEALTKEQLMQQQLAVKVRTDAPDFEILEWLEQKHHKTETEAQGMLQAARSLHDEQKRKKAWIVALPAGLAALGLAAWSVNCKTPDGALDATGIIGVLGSAGLLLLMLQLLRHLR